MGIERIVKATIGGALLYAAASIVVPYYATYAAATKAVAAGTGVYIGATYGSSGHSKPAH